MAQKTNQVANRFERCLMSRRCRTSIRFRGSCLGFKYFFKTINFIDHGGRQLDTVRSTIEMLPEIVEGIEKRGNKVEVYVDGGIRYGTDVLKCLALGAKYVFLGRPVLFSNTYDGERGISLMTEILEREMRIGMILLGVEKLSQINKKHIITSQVASCL